MNNTPTFLPGQIYLGKSGWVKHILVFVLDTTTYNFSNRLFCQVSPLCHEGYYENFVIAKHLIKFEFFPEDEEI